MIADTEVVKGYLVTHPDGYEARLGPDLTRAEIYAAQQHGTLEPLFVRRVIRAGRLDATPPDLEPDCQVFAICGVTK